MTTEQEDAMLWALEHFVHLDEANAKIHCAPVRFSPLTFRLAEALVQAGMADADPVAEVMEHRGSYEEDKGR